MAYETLLNIPAVAAELNAYSINTSGISFDVTLDIAGTTLGDKLGDEVAKVVLSLGRVGPLSAASLSATSIVFTLSSPSTGLLNTISPGVLVSSQFATNSAIFTINFPSSTELSTTTLSFSANGSTMTLFGNSVVDNFFYVNDAGVARTTAGHSRLVSYLG